MVREPLSPERREFGRRLGALLRGARGDRTLVEVAGAAGISAETLRKIEAGRIATPSFAVVAELGAVLGLSLDVLAELATTRPVDRDRAARSSVS